MAKIQTISNRQKKLQGHTRFVKNTPDTAPITRLWHMPKDFGKHAKSFYKEIGNRLISGRVLTDLDKYSFFELCYSLQILMDLRKYLSKTGYCVGEGNKIKKNPAATIYNEMTKQFWNNAARFGLTPSDRRKIDLPTDTNPNDSTREFFFGNKKTK